MIGELVTSHVEEPETYTHGHDGSTNSWFGSTHPVHLPMLSRGSHGLRFWLRDITAQTRPLFFVPIGISRDRYSVALQLQSVATNVTVILAYT